ncbi:hypothetical protein I3842_11G001800 [Carya illinoinensis]|uniref:SAM domain-containing protein n=1 Tax=Carya illinoinensis TaxID=32201 RepID=A0A922DKT6_CARIL|nr:hypothetical protein I3842_11G001800 [Carya illinoinensis]
MPEILSSAENQLNGVGGGPLLVASTETVGSKRQRRPSVRLGDIGGDQPFDSHVRRSPHPHPLHLHLHNNGNKHWKLAMKDSNNHSSASGKTSKTRTLFHLSSSETLDGEDKEGNIDGLALSSWKVKDSKKRAFTAKRVRSNWVSKVVDEGDGGVGAGAEGDDKYGGGEGENIDNGYRDFDVENSESPLKEQSPVHSLENLGLDGHGNERDLIYRRPIRARGVVSEGPHDGVELSGPSDTDWKCGTSGDRNGNNGGEDGVRIWLNGLGLGRYAPVFEIHEVDDEVLPMLTLDDLKDMGINAVGSRRKMYCAIQKLGKGFS